MKSASLPGVRLSGSGLYLCPQRQVYGQPPCRPPGVMQPVWRHMAASYHSRRRMLQPCTSAHAAQKSCGNEAGKLTAAMPCEDRYGIKESPAATSSGHGCRTFLVLYQRHRPRYLAFSSYTRLLSFCALKSGRPTVMRYSPE